MSKSAPSFWTLIGLAVALQCLHDLSGPFAGIQQATQPSIMGIRRLSESKGDEATKTGHTAEKGDATDGKDNANAKPKAAAKAEVNAKVDKALDDALASATANITVPCINLIYRNAFDPCGDMVLGEDGLNISTPFGVKTIPGIDLLKPEIKILKSEFQKHTVQGVVLLVVGFILYTLLVPSARANTRRQVQKIFAGDLEEDEDDLTEQEKQKEMEERLDPNSANFIAPGNIYRLLAVLHPGEIGFQNYFNIAFKAFVCAYMQVFLPVKIMINVFEEWSINGIKSPMYFIVDGQIFFAKFIALSSLCNLFASRCGENIVTGAQANFYILTHQYPTPSSEAGQDDSQTGLLSVAASGKVPSARETERAFAKSIMTPFLIMLNEYFWCIISMLLNFSMSLLLFFCMFLKIATYTGDAQHVAVVLVSLYFVFELDAKVMESDPKLRPSYRRMVLKQTEKRSYSPLWLNTIAGLAQTIIASLTPIGLLMLILVSWRSGDTIIGGDPF